MPPRKRRRVSKNVDPFLASTSSGGNGSHGYDLRRRSRRNAVDSLPVIMSADCDETSSACSFSSSDDDSMLDGTSFGFVPDQSLKRTIAQPMPVILSADGDVTSSSCSSYSDSGDSDSGNFLDSSSFSEDYTDISQSFSSDTELQQNASSSVPRARRQAPIDFGAADQVCSFCGAYFWMEERCKTSSRRGHPRYNRCCHQGRIALPLLKEPPALLSDLLDPRTGSDAKHFIEHIRKYNNVNALSSMGVKVVTSVNDGRGHYVFKISGQACHLMGSLLPPEGSPPKFAQLYIYDTANEIANRMAHFPHSSNPRDQPREHIITALRDMLNRENSVVQAYRTVAERVNSDPDSDMRIRICANRSNRPREYAAPSADEVVGLLVGDFNPQEHQRDIIVQYRSGELQRISSVHPSYLALQYPILFPYGEDSYRLEIEYDDEAPGAANVERPYMTMDEFYRYRFHFREGEALTMFKCGKIFQQVCVDVFACIDQARIYQLYEKQQVLRSDTISNIRAAVNKGDLRGNQIGKRTILPASHVGGPRYQYQNYQDAIAVCKHLGHPHLFITFTCNPDWPEIKRMLLPRQHPFGRPDLICRVFKMRLDELIRDIRDNNHFGPISGLIYTIEFQKRGLPHAHIIVWLADQRRMTTASEIDRFISAELPDPSIDLEGYEAVSQFMMHGPCGTLALKSPCMDGNICTKNYPKEFEDSTTISDDGFVVYKRRNNNITVRKNNIELDNRSVVPYNLELVLKHQAHINVEKCHAALVVKYLFKYICKGTDRSFAALEKEGVTVPSGTTASDRGEDELAQYLDCRYLTPPEAMW